MDTMPWRYDDRLLVGLKEQPSGYRYATEDYEIVQLIAVTRGRVRMQTPDSDRFILPGRFMLLRLGGRFVLSCPGSASYGGVFVSLRGVTGSRMHGRALGLFCPPQMQYLVAMLEEELRRPAGSGDLARHLGTSVLELALRAARAGEEEPREAVSRMWAERLRQAIENRIFTPASIRMLVDGWDIGYRQVSRHFHDRFGVSPKRYQLLCRMEHARRLLAETGLSVTSIAMELGFPSSQHFAAQFLALTGSSPTAARRAGPVTSGHTPT